MEIHYSEATPVRAAYAGIIASAQAQCLYQKLNLVKCEWIPGYSHLCCYYTRRCQNDPRGDKVIKRKPKAANVPFDADVLIVSEAGSGHGIWSIVPMTIMKKKKKKKINPKNCSERNAPPFWPQSGGDVQDNRMLRFGCSFPRDRHLMRYGQVSRTRQHR